MGNFVGLADQTDSQTANQTDHIDNIELRIYEIVEQLYPDDCEKITGMLVEMDQNELKELLDNRDELKKRIDLAARVVTQTSYSSMPTHNIGNKVYGTVQQLYPAFGRQITGMLLELGDDRLVELLDNREQLIEHIHKAGTVVMDTEVNKKALREEKSNPNKIKDKCISKAGDEQEKEELACQIFLQVLNQYPNTADKITGMLLEMDIENLREINKDNDLLMERASQAVQALGKEEKSFGTDESLFGASKNQDRELFLRHIDSELNVNSLKTQLVGLEEDMQKELIGEELYRVLFKIYPNYAEKATGMLLEVNINNLLETLANPELLHNRVEQAIEALDSKS